MKVTVSVICPVQNRRHVVGDTLRSLLNQSRKPHEIIVVDDASGDGSADFVEATAPSATVIRLQKNHGPGGARNVGLRAATGSHILFFDSDDVATLDYIEARAEAVEKTGAEIAYGAWLPVWFDGDLCQHDGFARQARAVPLPPISAFLRNWVLLIPNCLISRTLLEDVGGYPEAIRTGEDMLLLFKLLNRTDSLVHVSRSLLLCRQHPTGQISASPEGLAMRARDELVLTDTVAREITGGASRTACGWLDIMHWRGRRADAYERGVSFGIDTASTSRPTHLERLFAFCTAASRRVTRATSRRLSGHSIDGFYRPARVSENQSEAIRQLGLVSCARVP